MRYVINTFLGIGMLALVVLLALVMFNSFMTVAVAHTGRILDKNGVSAEKTGDGFIIKTQDGSMKVTGAGIELPEIPDMDELK